MMLTTQRPGLYIISQEIRKRCIFCVEDIVEGSIIEICPVIVLSPEDTKAIHKTFLHDYYFVWDIELGSSAIALGYGSLYNHSDTPNADFDIILESEEIRFYATQDIIAGTEIVIDYIGLKDEGSLLWFNPASAELE